MSLNITSAKAIGKIILIGEHSVVYGQPAIAIPFPSAKIETKISKTNSKIMIDSASYKGELSKAPKSLLGLTSVIKAVLIELNKPLEGLNIEILSTIPSQRGMGSSAAVAAATIRALYKFFEVDLDQKTLSKFTNYSEKIYHGNPSGIDTAIVVEEKPLYYVKGQPLQEFQYSLDGYLIVSDTGEKGQTKFAVSKVKSFIDNNKVQGKQIVEKLGKLSILAKESISNNQVLELATIMNQAQALLRSLGVSNEAIENLVKVSLDNGALASKLTGGGLGGCVITLCANKETAQKVEKALLDNGASETWIMNMAERKVI